MKRSLYLILILIITGLIYLRFLSSDRLVPPPPPSPTPSIVASPSPPVRTLTTLYFTLEYPTTATASSPSESPDGQTWSVSYLGDTQRASGRTQTELFDGYAVTLTRFETAGDDLAATQATADRQGIVDACGPENVTEIKPTIIAGHEALSFFGGCLGEATYYSFLAQDTLYRVTVMVVGPDSATPAYQATVDQMLASLKFL